MNAGTAIANERHAKWPAKLHGHDIDPHSFSLRFRQVLQPFAYRLTAGLCSKENCGEHSRHMDDCIISDTSDKRNLCGLELVV